MNCITPIGNCFPLSFILPHSPSPRHALCLCHSLPAHCVWGELTHSQCLTFAVLAVVARTARAVVVPGADVLTHLPTVLPLTGCYRGSKVKGQWATRLINKPRNTQAVVGCIAMLQALHTYARKLYPECLTSINNDSLQEAIGSIT